MSDATIVWLIILALCLMAPFYVVVGRMAYKGLFKADDDGLNFDEEKLSADMMRGVHEINSQVKK